MARREDYSTNTEADAGRFEVMHGGADYDPYEGYEPEPDVPLGTRPEAAGPLMDALRHSIQQARTLPNSPQRPWGAPLNEEQFRS